MRNAEDIFASGQISADRLTEVCKDFNRIDPLSFADVARQVVEDQAEEKNGMDASLLGTSEGLECKDWPRTMVVDGISSPTLDSAGTTRTECLGQAAIHRWL